MCNFRNRRNKKYIKKLNNLCPGIFKEISKIAKFNIRYKPSIIFEDYTKENIRTTLEQKYKDSLEKDIIAKTTLYGPHRDDFEFCIAEDNLRSFGSQGQQKMAVIALKLSEIELFKDYKQTSPIILLDDVFSDLDNNKKNNLLKHINKDMQVIITTTDLDNIDKKIIKQAKLINIKNGKIVQNEVIK